MNKEDIAVLAKAAQIVGRYDARVMTDDTLTIDKYKLSIEITHNDFLYLTPLSDRTVISIYDNYDALPMSVVYVHDEDLNICKVQPTTIPYNPDNEVDMFQMFKDPVAFLDKLFNEAVIHTTLERGEYPVDIAEIERDYEFILNSFVKCLQTAIARRGSSNNLYRPNGNNFITSLLQSVSFTGNLKMTQQLPPIRVRYHGSGEIYDFNFTDLLTQATVKFVLSLDQESPVFREHDYEKV